MATCVPRVWHSEKMSSSPFRGEGPLLFLLRHLSQIKVVSPDRAFPPSQVNSVDEKEEATFGPDFVELLHAKPREECVVAVTPSPSGTTAVRQGIGIVCRPGRRAWWMSMERVHHLSVALATIQASVLDFHYIYSLSLSSSPWSRSGNGTPWPCLLPLHTLSSFNRITQAGRQAHRSPFPKTFFLFLYLHSFHNLGFGARLWTYRK